MYFFLFACLLILKSLFICLFLTEGCEDMIGSDTFLLTNDSVKVFTEDGKLLPSQGFSFSYDESSGSSVRCVISIPADGALDSVLIDGRFSTASIDVIDQGIPTRVADIDGVRVC